MNPAQEKTLNSRKGKVTFGIYYFYFDPPPFEYAVGGWRDEHGEIISSDESAYNNMAGRGLKALGEKWRKEGCFAEYDIGALLKRLSFFCVPCRDILAAILVALEID